MKELNTELEKKINLVRQQLNSLLDVEPLNSGTVLELSRALDVLIVKYQSLKN